MTTRNRKGILMVALGMATVIIFLLTFPSPGVPGNQGCKGVADAQL